MPATACVCTRTHRSPCMHARMHANSCAASPPCTPRTRACPAHRSSPYAHVAHARSRAGEVQPRGRPVRDVRQGAWGLPQQQQQRAWCTQPCCLYGGRQLCVEGGRQAEARHRDSRHNMHSAPLPTTPAPRRTTSPASGGPRMASGLAPLRGTTVPSGAAT